MNQKILLKAGSEFWVNYKEFDMSDVKYDFYVLFKWETNSRGEKYRSYVSSIGAYKYMPVINDTSSEVRNATRMFRDEANEVATYLISKGESVKVLPVSVKYCLGEEYDPRSI